MTYLGEEGSGFEIANVKALRCLCAWEPGEAGITALPISPAQPVALESLVGKGPLSHTLMENLGLAQTGVSLPR